MAEHAEAIAMMHWYGQMWPGAWLLMGLFWMVLLGAILFLVLRLLPSGRTPDPRQRADDPLDVLDHRFARGEVDQETYQAQRAALEAALSRKPHHP